MKKKFINAILLIAIMVCAKMLNSQSLSMIYNGVFISDNSIITRNIFPADYASTIISIKNNSIVTKNVKVKKQVLLNTITGSDDAFAFAGNMYSPSVLISSTPAIILQNGIDSSFVSDFSPNNSTGTCEIKYTFFVVNDSSDKINVIVKYNSIPPALLYPDTAGLISGLINVNKGKTNAVYMVPPIARAQSYIWNLPYGFIGNSDSNSIIVEITNDAQSGNISVKGHNNYGNGIASAISINVNPYPNAQIIIWNPTTYCIGDTISLNTSLGYNRIIWNSGDTTSTIKITNQGYFSVLALNNNQWYADTVFIPFYPLPYDESICIVTFDSISGRNLIIWNKTQNVRTKAFNIYKETIQTGQFQLITSQAYNNLSEFIDISSNPNQQSYKYYITALDSCLNESTLKSIHKTIYLSSNIGFNGENNLIWTPYFGFNYSSFNIYRNNNNSNYILIGSLSSTNYSFSDITPPLGSNKYYIEAINQNGCNITKLYNSAISNIVQQSNVNIENFNNKKIGFYYNSEINMLFIENILKGFVLSIYDLKGKLLVNRLIEDNSKINVSRFAKGVYIVKLNSNKEALVNKFIKK